MPTHSQITRPGRTAPAPQETDPMALPLTILGFITLATVTVCAAILLDDYSK